jgi:putative transposase
VFLDATYCKARVNHRVVSQAIVVAIGVTADGNREVLGMDVGDSEDGAFWTAFLRGLKARGLHGVQLVISDAHSGLKQAISAVLIGSAWQRCRVHFMRNVLAACPRATPRWSPPPIRTIFAQPDAEHVHSQLDMIATMLGRQFPSSGDPCCKDASRRPPGLRLLPGRALEEDLVHQPPCYLEPASGCR